MDLCEQHQITISAFLDGEAEQTELADLLDHLPTCGACQAFYRDVRALQDLTAASVLPVLEHSRAAEAQPRRGMSAAHRAKGAFHFWGRRIALPAWACSAAALAIIASGLWGSGLLAPEKLPPAGAASVLPSAGKPLRVNVGENRQPMDGARFAQLVVDVLRADAHDRGELLAVLRDVAPAGEEGFGEVTPYTPRREGGQREQGGPDGVRDDQGVGF